MSGSGECGTVPRLSDFSEAAHSLLALHACDVRADFSLPNAVAVVLHLCQMPDLADTAMLLAGQQRGVLQSIPTVLDLANKQSCVSCICLLPADCSFAVC